jgi:hypothetical protein
LILDFFIFIGGSATAFILAGRPLAIPALQEKGQRRLSSANQKSPIKIQK